MVDNLQEDIVRLNDLKYSMAVAQPKSDTSDIDRTISELNRRNVLICQTVGDRQTRLEQALLACGKFHDALQSLLEWLADTRELVQGQGPIAAADLNVLKAQMQEQKVSS